MYRIKINMVAIFAALALATAVGCESDDSESGDDGVDESELSAEVESADEEGDDEDGDAASEADDEGDQERAESDDEGDDSRDAGSSDADNEELAEGDAEEDSEEDGEEDADAGESETAENEGEEIDPAEFAHLPFFAKGTVAVINGTEVTAQDFNQAAEEQVGALPPEMVEAQGAQMREMFLEAVVISRLIKMEIEERGVEVSNAEISQAVEDYKKMMEMQVGGDAQQAAAMMAEQGIDDEAIRSQVELEVGVKKLISENTDISVSDAEVRQYFDDNEQLFAQNSTAHARHILIDQTEDGAEEKAKRIAGELRDGADFAELASEHSICPSAEVGGDLGQFARNQVVPEFAEVAFEHPIGEIADPVRSDLGWHVIRVEDRQEQGEVSFEDIRGELKMMIEAQKLQQETMKFVEQLRRDSDVEVNEENVVFNG